MTDFLKRELDDGSIEVTDPLDDSGEESIAVIPAEGLTASEIVRMLAVDFGFDIGEADEL